MRVCIVSDLPPQRWINVRHLTYYTFLKRLGVELIPLIVRLAKRFIHQRVLHMFKRVDADVYWCFHPIFVKYCKGPVVVDIDDPKMDEEWVKSSARLLHDDRVAYVVTANGTYARFLIEELRLSNVVIIPGSVDLNLFKPIDCEEGYDLLYMSSILKPERVEPLLKALGRRRHELLLLGRFDDIQFKAKLSALNNIKCVGWKPYRELPRIINQCKICLQSTLNDVKPFVEKYGLIEPLQFSMKVLQYAACAKPIVALPSLPNVEVLNMGGILLRREEEMPEVLSALLQDREERRRIGVKVRRYVEERHNATYWSKKYFTLLKRVVDEGL